MRMPEALVPSALAVIVFGLLASLGWGVADFGGGLASRRFLVTAEGLDALRRSYQSVVTLARGLEHLLGKV